MNNQNPLKLIEPLKIIIAGGRTFNDYNLLTTQVRQFISDLQRVSHRPYIDYNHVIIIQGEAKGADLLGKQFAFDNNYQCMGSPADWNKYGKRAGFIRNEEMAKEANHLIAFWDGKSSGTKHMITTAQNYGLGYKIVRY